MRNVLNPKMWWEMRFVENVVSFEGWKKFAKNKHDIDFGALPNLDVAPIKMAPHLNFKRVSVWKDDSDTADDIELSVSRCVSVFIDPCGGTGVHGLFRRLVVRLKVASIDA